MHGSGAGSQPTSASKRVGRDRQRHAKRTLALPQDQLFFRRLLPTPSLRVPREYEAGDRMRCEELGKVDEPYLGTGRNGWGCFVPDLTRLAALPCEEARRRAF